LTFIKLDERTKEEKENLLAGNGACRAFRSIVVQINHFTQTIKFRID
jgi:hypothetical protein